MKKNLQFQVSAKALAKKFGPGAITFKNQATDPAAEIVIYGEIGDSWYDPASVTPSAFKAGLDAIPAGRDITICINSPGGNVFDGYAIYNLLRVKSKTNKVVSRIDGLAASIASVIALAGIECQMPETSDMMIHPAWGMCMGNADDMLQTADLLEKLSNQIAAVYARYSGKTVEECTAAMNAETWMTGTEAKAFGLCDTLLDPEDPDAEPDDDPDDAQNNFSRRRVPKASVTKPNPQAPVASGAKTPSMKDKITALLTERGVKFEATATEDELLALLEANPKPKAAPLAKVETVAAPATLTLADVATEVARVTSITARVKACVSDLKIPAATEAAALKRSLADATYLAEIEALTPRPVGAEPIPNGQAGDAPKVITEEAYRAMKPHEAKAFFKAGGKLKG